MNEKMTQHDAIKCSQMTSSAEIEVLTGKIGSEGQLSGVGSSQH